MKQRIQASITTPSSGYSIKILSVHEADNQLIAVSKVKEPRGMVLEAIGSAQDVVIVKTSRKQNLPVKHYLTDIPKREGEHHIGNYGRGERWGNQERTEFTAIENISEIADILNRCKCIYQPRTDGMTAARITRFEQTHIKSQEVQTESANFTNEELSAVYNVHMVNDDGTIKVVVEEIHRIEKDKNYTSLAQIFKNAGKLGGGKMDVKNTLHMTYDDKLRFDGFINGEVHPFETNSVEFSLPANDPAMILYFLRFMDLMMHTATENDDYSKPYAHVQIGNDSILSCFDELFVTSKHSDDYSEKDSYNIISPAPIVIADFLNRKGTVHQPETTTTSLLHAFTQIKGAPEYASTQTMLKNVLEKLGDTNIYHSTASLEKITGVNVGELIGNTNEARQKEILQQLEESLSNNETYQLASMFLQDLKEKLVLMLYFPALGKRAHDGGTYQLNYTEYSLLMTSEFMLREDGRMSLIPGGAGYVHYDRGSNTHDTFDDDDNDMLDEVIIDLNPRNNKDILKEEMIFLAKTLGLEFAEGCDFHKEMIFTAESTLKLKAMGMHLVAANSHPLPVNAPVDEAVEQEPMTVTVNPLTRKTAAEIVKQHPYVTEILSIMKRTGVLTGNARDDSRLFADLIYACDKITHPKPPRSDATNTSPKNDTIDSLLKLYRLAAGTGDRPCFITPEIHKAIVGRIANYDQLEETAKLFDAIPDMNSDKARKLFLGATDFIGINDLTNSLDQTYDSFLRFFNAIEDYRSAAGFRDMMSMTLMFGKGWKWMTKDLYNIVVDNIKTGNCYKVLSGFDSLSTANVLDEFKDRFLQNLHLELPLHELQMSDMLTKENIELAFQNPDYKAALKQCEMFSLTGWRSKNYSDARDKELKHGLLRNPECSHAIKVLGDAIQAKFGKDLDMSKKDREQCNADFESLIDCAGIRKPETPAQSDLSDAFKRSMTLFSPKKSVSVTERLAELEKKYQSQDAVEVAQLKAAM